MSKVYPATSLIGGGTGALDAIDGTSLADKDVAIVTVQDGNLYPYVLDEDSAEAENSPYIISPDANAGDKRWKLVGVQGVFSHVRVSTSVAQSIPNSLGTTVIFGTEDEDMLGEYNNATGVFTAIYAGYYLISAAIKFASASWTVGEVVVPILNFSVGSDIQNFVEVEVTRTANVPATISRGVTLAAGETVEFQLYQTQGTAVALDGNDKYNWLTIDRIA